MYARAEKQPDQLIFPTSYTISTPITMNEYSRSSANANRKASKKSKGGKKDIPIFLQKVSLLFAVWICRVFFAYSQSYHH